MERYRQQFPKLITIEDWLAKAHPDAPALPWVSDRGEEICSFAIIVPEGTALMQVVLFNAHGREVVMTGSATAIEQTAVALGAGPGEIVFLPKAASRQAAPIGDHQKIIDAAVDGEAGRLVFTFTLANKGERTEQINDTIRRLPLGDLFVRVRLNPDDAQRQPIPTEAMGRFRSWGADDAVPAGEFHLAISRVQ